jgi:hypothetical protein
MGTGSFPGVKATGRDAHHTPPPSAEVEEELSYNSTHPMGSPGPVTGFPLPLPYPLPTEEPYGFRMFLTVYSNETATFKARVAV